LIETEARGKANYSIGSVYVVLLGVILGVAACTSAAVKTIPHPEKARPSIETPSSMFNGLTTTTIAPSSNPIVPSSSATSTASLSNLPGDFPQTLVMLDDIEPWRVSESGSPGGHTITAQYATLPETMMQSAENDIVRLLSENGWNTEVGNSGRFIVAIAGFGWRGEIAITSPGMGETEQGQIFPISDANLIISQCPSC